MTDCQFPRLARSGGMAETGHLKPRQFERYILDIRFMDIIDSGDKRDNRRRAWPDRESGLQVQ